MLFVSKKDPLYFLVVWGTIAFVFLSVVLDFSFTIFNFVWAFIVLLIIGFLIWLWFGTMYKVEKETVHVQNGPFTSEVDIHDIKRISKRKSLLATPALAVDRLVLHYGTYNEIQISPKDESKFINLLLTKNPQIKIDEK